MLLGALAEARADELLLCVRSDSGAGLCAGRTCDLGGFSTVAAALSAAEGLPPGEDGRPGVEVCVDASQSPHVENVVVDNRGGRLGAPLVVTVDGTLCPAGEAAAPVVAWTGTSTPRGEDRDRLRVAIDRSSTGPCGASVGPGVLVEGGERLFVETSQIVGTERWAVRSRGPAAPWLEFSSVRMADGDGPAVWAEGHISLLNVVIEGFRVGPDTGGLAIVQVLGDDGRLDVVASALARNVVDASDGSPRSVLRGPLQRLDRSFIGLNLLSDGAPVAIAQHTPTNLRVEDGYAWGPLPIVDTVSPATRGRRGAVSIAPPRAPRARSPALDRSVAVRIRRHPGPSMSRPPRRPAGTAQSSSWSAPGLGATRASSQWGVRFSSRTRRAAPPSSARRSTPR